MTLDRMGLRFALPMLAGMGLAATAYAADGPRNNALCVNGYPAPRRPDITYGRKHPHHGYQRDHYVSLGLGGPDTPDNVFYQRLPDAYHKDASERDAERMYCAGYWELDHAINQVLVMWPLTDSSYQQQFITGTKR